MPLAYCYCPACHEEADSEGICSCETLEDLKYWREEEESGSQACHSTFKGGINDVPKHVDTLAIFQHVVRVV